MANTELAKLTAIGGGMLMNIVYGILVIAIAVGLYYGTRWFQKNSRKQKSFTITAEISDMNGVIEFDKLALVKAEGSGMLEMIFQKRKTDSIPPIPKHLIKGGHVVLLNYAPGHYAVIDTAATLANYTSGINQPVIVSLGMKKYIIAKQRDRLNRNEDKRRNWEIYAPWITLGSVALGALLLAALLLFIGARIDASNISARMAECVQAGWKVNG